ncbi:MAG: DUF6913 domain-containing protein [Bacteroidales bacterium]
MSIKDYISRYLQNKQIKNHHRTVEFQNFAEVQSVGIIVSPKYMEELLYLRNKLKDNEITDVKHVIIDHELKNKDIYVVENDTYGRSSFSRWGLLLDEDLKEFVARPFDLLFDLSEYNQYTTVMLKFSTAKLRVGNKSELEAEYDFIIAYDKMDMIFLDQAIHYLQEIKS